jgi:ribosomal protein L11 methyltransferase
MEPFARADSKPIKIRKRLMIVRPDALRTVRPTADAIKAALLVIPGSLAFRTSEHATTAMSLRLLDKLTRRWKRGWSLVDLGTGSGILALAAKYFSAGRVIGIDNDPAAISMAKSTPDQTKFVASLFN